MLWRPRSIYQLALLGFTFALAPLCLAIFTSLQTLSEQSVHGQQLSRELLETTRLSQSVQAQLVDLERLSRQYATLGDSSLLPLFDEIVKQLDDELDRLKQKPTLTEDQPSNDAAPTLLSYLDSIEQQLALIKAGVPLMNAERPQSFEVLVQFDQLNEDNNQLQTKVTERMDLLLMQQVQRLEHVEQTLRNRTLLLALFTLFSALLFSYWINKPMRQLKRKIRALGNKESDSVRPVGGPLEVRELGSQLDWLKQRLEQLEEQKQQFLRHMSHELKTPLASLREGADLMAEEVVGPLEPNQREVIEIIQQNSWELQRLIENLLDMSQLEQPATLASEPLELEPYVQELLIPYQMLSRRRQLDITIEVNHPQYRCDPIKLKGALDNLFSNAINYCNERGQILIHCDKVDNNLIIDVANSGPVIPATEREQIFRPFFQGGADRGGPIKGSGVGLSVARECVEALGGQLAVIEYGGWNCCFRLSLPLEESTL
ncbi:HAMP domain-containing protein [Motiliproteus coralliicola]|uniref:histidine kinase n=1 Tax=Motiliproteus coralliicola TaxID=2283196 RepID=A0A369WUY3_9GAMM|nr:ATP-binding protein [Motiliproteus coralliicola]RDE24346.1 HAMP domain-containing protein [Motiliproteus coralliicola]